MSQIDKWNWIENPEITWENKEAIKYVKNDASNNINEILREVKNTEEWKKIINYFLGLDKCKLKNRVWVNKRLETMWFYWEWNFDYINFIHYEKFATHKIHRNNDSSDLVDLWNWITRTYRFLYDTDKAWESSIKMEQEFNKYDLEILEAIKKFQLWEIEYDEVPSYNEYIELEWLNIKKNQAWKVFSYEDALKICKNNNTRIPTKVDMEKLFEIPNIMEQLKITNSSVWCEDENWELLIAWFRNKCFCKTNKENKLYLLEVWN